MSALSVDNRMIVTAGKPDAHSQGSRGTWTVKRTVLVEAWLFGLKGG
jgi:hypothetical protein